MRTTPSAINLLLVALAGLVLIINPVITLNFDEIFLHPKVLWTYAVLLPCTLLVLWEHRTSWSTLRGWPAATATALLCWMLSAALTHPQPGLNFWGASDRADGVLMHVIYALLLLSGLLAWQKEALRQNIIRGLQVTTLLLALSSLAQQLHLWLVPGAGSTQGVSASLAGGTLGNQGYMGGALALLLPLIVGHRFHSDRLTRCVTVITTWAVTGTDTRGVWLAALAGLACLWVWQRTQLTWKTWSAVSTGILLSVLTTLVLGNQSRFDDPALLGQGSGRALLWTSALDGIRAAPVFGGPPPALWNALAQRPPENVLAEMGESNLQSLEPLPRLAHQPPRYRIRRADGQGAIVTASINKVHNEYLDYALTYGVPAALLFLGLIGGCIGTGRRAATVVTAGVVAYAVYLLTWPEVIRFAPLAWFMMGIAASPLSTRKLSGKPASVRPAGPRSLLRPRPQCRV
ncbi:O-antigen ligase family protein [Deinococcus ficus]|uniref:O-antigen ligase family protein n=1 Tax=Deinococcus ficus TaxID=317577 RepID=UPI0009FEEA81|nr:O-antigen ligase family protein [Deinococcus ficus]